jgi:hydroxymethylbilane synthase
VTEEAKALRLGTRASALARWQAEWVAARLQERGVAVELVPITTSGDRHEAAIRGLAVEGVFTKELERALLDGRIDLAVHSLKDLPTAASAGLVLAAVPKRAVVADALVCREKGGRTIFGEDKDSRPLFLLAWGASVGTGSLRRRAQLLHVRPDLQMKDVRGNVETRLRKLEQGEFDALILAEAGLRRLGLAAHIAEQLPPALMLPAVGQGALALETRSDDAATRQVVAPLDDPSTHAAVLAERTMLGRLQGGCLAPVAGLAQVEGEQLTLLGRVLSQDGARRLEARQTAPPGQAESLGLAVAEALLAQGAGELVRASRGAQ